MFSLLLFTYFLLPSANPSTQKKKVKKKAKSLNVKDLISVFFFFLTNRKWKQQQRQTKKKVNTTKHSYFKPPTYHNWYVKTKDPALFSFTSIAIQPDSPQQDNVLKRKRKKKAERLNLEKKVEKKGRKTLTAHCRSFFFFKYSLLSILSKSIYGTGKREKHLQFYIWKGH